MLASTPSCSAARRSARSRETSNSRSRNWNPSRTSEHQRDRRHPGARVGARHERAQPGAEDLAREHRQEDRAELVRQREVVGERLVAGDHHEVQEVREQEHAEHEQRERGGGFVDVGGLDDQAADERERGERGQVGEQERAGVAGADLVAEHAGDADRGSGSGPEQRHGEHEREERAGDALAVVADGEQVAREREHEDDGDEGEWLPLLRGRDERGQGRGDREDDRLGDEQRCPSRQHQVAKTKAAKAR